jgi:hypothetical protein
MHQWLSAVRMGSSRCSEAQVPTDETDCSTEAKYGYKDTFFIRLLPISYLRIPFKFVGTCPFLLISNKQADSVHEEVYVTGLCHGEYSL